MDRTTARSESAMDRGGREEGTEQPKPRVSAADVLAAGAAVIKEEVEEEEIEIVHEKLLPQPIVHHKTAVLAQPLDSSMEVGAAADEETAALAAVAVAAVRALAADAPPSAKDSDFWTGNTACGECPRGCVYYACGPDARKRHYKRHHYNVFYVIAKLPPTRTPFDQWLHLQFGEDKRGDRACVLCIPSRRQFAVYLTRIDLVRHIQSTHPVRFFELSSEYSSHDTGYAPEAAVHQLLNADSNPQSTAVAAASSLKKASTQLAVATPVVVASAASTRVAAVAAIAATSEVTAGGSIALNDPPSVVDEAYWAIKSSVSATCPRGCTSASTSTFGRRCHYRRVHYNIYYSLIDKNKNNRMMESVERWLNMKFGDERRDCRVCVNCSLRSREWYPNRVELVRHMQVAHSEMFAGLAAEYGSIVGGVIHDAEMHGILMNDAW